ncbi:MAG: hypothetical protein ACLFS3_03205, partial [Candidatus Aenigmatarchaeota archaeon]
NGEDRVNLEGSLKKYIPENQEPEETIEEKYKEIWTKENYDAQKFAEELFGVSLKAVIEDEETPNEEGMIKAASVGYQLSEEEIEEAGISEQEYRRRINKTVEWISDYREDKLLSSEE